MKLTIIQPNGPDIIMNCKYNESLRQVIDRINKFKVPPLTQLVNKDGKTMPDFLPIRGEITLYLQEQTTSAHHCHEVSQ